jgi:hypothetical protein
MHIHPLDLTIVIAYLLGVTALGMRFRRLQQAGTASDTQAAGREYFLGGRTAPWWALAFSIVATETSTLTIIGAPAISYADNLVHSTGVRLPRRAIADCVAAVARLFSRRILHCVRAHREALWREDASSSRQHVSHYARDC